MTTDPVLVRGGHVLLPDRTTHTVDIAIRDARIAEIGDHVS